MSGGASRNRGRKEPQEPIFGYEKGGLTGATSQPERSKYPNAAASLREIQNLEILLGLLYEGPSLLCQARSTPPEQLGMVPRAVMALFDRVEAIRAKEALGANACVVRVSFLQIYNEKVFDLLNPSLSVSQREAGGRGEDFSGLRMRWDALKRHFFVENLFQNECNSADEALQYYQAGIANKHVASTAMNVASSRSHTVLVLTLLRREGMPGDDGTPEPFREASCPKGDDVVCPVEL